MARCESYDFDIGSDGAIAGANEQADKVIEKRIL